MIIKNENEVLKYAVEYYINYDNTHLDEGIYYINFYIILYENRKCNRKI